MGSKTSEGLPVHQTINESNAKLHKTSAAPAMAVASNRAIEAYLGQGEDYYALCLSQPSNGEVSKSKMLAIVFASRNGNNHLDYMSKSSRIMLL
jgi:hypothetical protein